MARNSSDIKMDILDHLARDSRLESDKIKVEFCNGVAVLSGSVHSLAAKDAAESGCWAVSGVSGVENQLDVVFPEAYKRPSDEAIRESVEQLLRWDPDIYLQKISMFVSEGRVVLEGVVDKLWKKIRAEQLAGSAGGVVTVTNKITVALTAQISDEKIGQEIISTIHRNRILNINSISVEVINSRVILSGTVPNRVVFDTIEDIARYTAGVSSIENRMAISS